MQELLAEAGVELLPAVGQAVAAVVLTLAGTAAELNGLATLTGGDLLLGAWLCYMGAIALYAGLFVLGPNAFEALTGHATAAD